MEALGAPLDPHRDFETVLEPNDAFQADQEAGISEANSVASSIYYVDGNAGAAQHLWLCGSGNDPAGDARGAMFWCDPAGRSWVNRPESFFLSPIWYTCGTHY